MDEYTKGFNDGVKHLASTLLSMALQLDLNVSVTNLLESSVAGANDVKDAHADVMDYTDEALKLQE